MTVIVPGMDKDNDRVPLRPRNVRSLFFVVVVVVAAIVVSLIVLYCLICSVFNAT